MDLSVQKPQQNHTFDDPNSRRFIDGSKAEPIWEFVISIGRNLNQTEWEKGFASITCVSLGRFT